MLKTIRKNKDLQKKLLITFLLLVLTQFLSNIPTPGINRDTLSTFFESNLGQALGFFSLFSGNSLQNMSMFMLGISPYITASIILQLLRVSFTKFDDMAKDGKEGERKYKIITYASGAIFGVIQAIPLAISFGKSGVLVENTPKYIALVSASLILGSVIFMLIGFLIDKFGIKNGISLILMTNIISRIPGDLMNIYEVYMHGQTIPHWILTILAVLLLSAFLIVWTIYLQDGEKRVPTQYSGRIASTSQYGNTKNESYIPIKVNVAGVMPIIFTLNIFQTVTLVLAMTGASNDGVGMHISRVLNTQYWFNPDNMIYTLGIILYAALLVFFQYFYTIIQFDTEKIANNLKAQGGVVTGIRPGKPTKEFLDKKLKSIIIVGSALLFVVAIVPVIVSGLSNLKSLSLGGTSIIIIVGVLVETYKLLESDCLQNVQDSSFLW